LLIVIELIASDSAGRALVVPARPRIVRVEAVDLARVFVGEEGSE
jgi:hypothetical protein